MNRVVNILKNKYFLSFIIALIWISFLDSYNLVAQYKVSQKIEHLNQDIEFYQKALKDLNFEERSLQHDEEAIERLAREKYYMSQKNEDVFLIVDN